MNSSTRESLDTIGESIVKAPQVLIKVETGDEDGDGSETGETGVTGDSKEDGWEMTEDVDEEAVEEMNSDESDSDTDADSGGDTAVVEMSGVDGDVSHPTVKTARTDYQRLVSELQSKDLHPIRLVLGCPLADNLALIAGKTLLDAGISVHELQELGYPSSIIQVFIEAAGTTMKTV